ncbi:MAG: hypothetical protein ACR2HH_05960 [Chthoniobacterales bacterium]
MATSLKTVDAVVEADGTVRLRQPMHLAGPALAVVTLIVEEDEPNQATREAIAEPTEGLPRFNDVDTLFQELQS